VAAIARHVGAVPGAVSAALLSQSGDYTHKEIPMGVVSLTRYESQPGHTGKHLEIHMEALERLRAMGIQAVAMQPLAGGDVGSLAMSVNYASYADYATSMQKVQGDAGWQEFYAAAAASGAAVQVESSLFNDLDPTFQPAGDRPLGVIIATQWRAIHGKMEAFVGKVLESMPISERMGGRSRPMQSIVGSYPMSMLVATTFADMDAYGSYADTANTDPEWQTFWQGAMSDPTADLLRTGLYVNMSD